MSDRSWVEQAMEDDLMVAEILLSFRRSRPRSPLLALQRSVKQPQRSPRCSRKRAEGSNERSAGTQVSTSSAASSSYMSGADAADATTEFPLDGMRTKGPLMPETTCRCKRPSREESEQVPETAEQGDLSTFPSTAAANVTDIEEENAPENNSAHTVEVQKPVYRVPDLNIPAEGMEYFD